MQQETIKDATLQDGTDPNSVVCETTLFGLIIPLLLWILWCTGCG